MRRLEHLSTGGPGAETELGGAEGKRVWFAGERAQGGGDGVDVGLDVGRGGRAGVVGVAGVGAGDAVTEVAFYPGEGGVPEPVGGDALSGDPGELAADAIP
ncbi:hypothetical protein Apa02nite_053980 [Actinoplanes palleronii]|uniref:Uncharacterized protein n=1 Tax=Actinoplanes palleronii TaxID=113570 RepID=A0ABQ4BF22_9ACTN|nr:hypothetical protein Apa02nite_053980 [Actinoplanes palleronii]